MKFLPLIALLAGSLLVSGCYTQLETVERTSHPSEQRASGYTAGHGDAYLDYYTDDHAYAYKHGYYDGLFDASLGFRYYSFPRHRASLGFHWGRPFYAFGFSYGHYYDPFWHYHQLYDPFFFSYYGYYRYPGFHRYRHFGHFYGPGFWGYSNFIVYNNFYTSPGSGNIVQGPRNSGVHRGNMTRTRGDGRVRGNGLAGADDRTRVRGFGSDLEASPGFRSSGSGSSVQRRPAENTDVNRTRSAPNRANVNRSRGSSNNTGNVNRSRGSSNNSGNVNRNRGNNNNNNRGSVNRNRGNNNSSGNVNRSSGGNNSSASPQRSRSSSNNSGNRNRNRDRDNSDSISMIQPVLQMSETGTLTYTIGTGNTV